VRRNGLGICKNGKHQKILVDKIKECVNKECNVGGRHGHYMKLETIFDLASDEEKKIMLFNMDAIERVKKYHNINNHPSASKYDQIKLEMYRKRMQ
jgi:hypothetical protein